MQDFISIIKDFGPYITLPIIVYFIVNWLKTQITFFKSVNGLRIIHFLPVVLGSLGGLLLPEEDLGGKLLVGGGLGCLNLFIYKVVSVTLAKKISIEDRIVRKSVNGKVV